VQFLIIILLLFFQVPTATYGNCIEFFREHKFSLGFISQPKKTNPIIDRFTHDEIIIDVPFPSHSERLEYGPGQFGYRSIKLSHYYDTKNGLVARLYQPQLVKKFPRALQVKMAQAGLKVSEELPQSGAHEEMPP